MAFTSRISSKSISVPKLRKYSDCEKLIAVVPVIPISRLGNYYLAISYFGILVVFFATATTLRLRSGVNGSFWNTCNLMQILIGVLADILPRARVQGIIFIFFAFISMKYFADFYDKILSIRLIYGAVTFDTFANIDNSQLRIYIDSNISKVICIMEELLVIKKINVSVMRIAKPVFACLNWEYGLEAGSPYIKRLQRLTIWLLEVGMNQCLNRNNKLSVGAAMLRLYRLCYPLRISVLLKIINN